MGISCPSFMAEITFMEEKVSGKRELVWLLKYIADDLEI